MSGKNRVTHKKGPAARQKKARRGSVQAQLLSVFKSSLLAGLPPRQRAKLSRGS
jgi:hypothetical protein